MQLLRVEYEFFDYEDPSDHAAELDRQIRLQFSDSPALYLSWTWERQHGPDSEPYSIAFAQISYFSDIAAHIIDVSDSPLWAKHIGRDVEILYVPPGSPGLEYQVLEVRSATHRTYVYSLGVDRVRISDISPDVTSQV